MESSEDVPGIFIGILCGISQNFPKGALGKSLEKAKIQGNRWGFQVEFLREYLKKSWGIPSGVPRAMLNEKPMVGYNAQVCKDRVRETQTTWSSCHVQGSSHCCNHNVLHELRLVWVLCFGLLCFCLFCLALFCFYLFVLLCVVSFCFACLCFVSFFLICFALLGLGLGLGFGLGPQE